METIKVFIPESASVEDFVGRTKTFPFDLNLGSGKSLVDAKSLLGVLYMAVGRITSLTAPKENLPLVEEKLQDYLVEV